MQKSSVLFLFAVLISGTLFSNFAFAEDGLIAEDDFYSINEDSLLTVDSFGVLLNDTTSSSDTFDAILVTDVDFGTLTLHQNGNFTYFPDENFDLTDSFTYATSNGTHNSNNATVTISINPINDAPVAQDDHAETQENVPIRIDVLENDFDVDNDSLNILLEIDPSETRGFVEIEDSQVLFTPIVGFVGNTTFSYIISDGDETSNNANVTISVVDSDEQSNDSLFEQIFEQIQSIFDRVTILEDEVIQLKEENTALEERISALEALHSTGTSGNTDTENNKKVTVCHKDKNTISISKNAIPAHLNHGDYLGKCSNSYYSSNPTSTTYTQSATIQSTTTFSPEKSDVCHNGKVTLSLPAKAARNHLENHDDDYLGQCSENSTSQLKAEKESMKAQKEADRLTKQETKRIQLENLKAQRESEKAQKETDRLAKLEIKKQQLEAEKIQREADRLAKQEAQKAAQEAERLAKQQAEQQQREQQQREDKKAAQEAERLAKQQAEQQQREDKKAAQEAERLSKLEEKKQKSPPSK
jgi:VCBS repeat-containing protein